jgi:hypothetical protein
VLRDILPHWRAAVALATPIAANADEGETLHWQSIVGILQANNVVGSGSGAVTGGGQPWTTSGGHASVDLRTGQVNFVMVLSDLARCATRDGRRAHSHPARLPPSALHEANRSVRLVPVRAVPDLDDERHGKLRDAGHQPG